MSWAYFTPETESDEINLSYTIGEDQKELRILARRISTTYPILSSFLALGNDRIERAQGYKWEDDIYSRTDDLNNISYVTTYYNSTATTEQAQQLARFTELLMELEEAAEAGGSNVITMGTTADAQYYDHSETHPTSPAQGQIMSYGEDATCEISLYTYVDYQPDPVSIAVSGGLFNVMPTGEQGRSYIINSAGQNAYYNSETPPSIVFWSVPVQMDDQSGDGDHYGETVQCLLIIVHMPGSSRPYTSTLISLNAFDTRPIEDDPTTDQPDQTVTPSGWVGNWDFSSDSDDVQPVGGHDFCNRWAHGVRLYYISDTQAEAFMSALWSMTLSQAVDLAIESALFRANVDFVRGVICLHKLPVVIGTSGSSALTIMGYDLSKTFPGLGSFAKVSGTYGSVMQLTTNELQVPQTFGDAVFLDWQCKAQIRLPFVGMVPIDIKSIRGGSIKVSYNIDVLTGNLLAQVFCKSSYGSKPQVLLYQGSGNCALPIPYSGNTEGAFKQLGAVAGIAGGIAAGVATGSLSDALSGLRGMSYGRNTAEYQYTATEAGSMTDLSIKLIITGEVPIIPPRQRELEGFQAATTAAVSQFVGSGYLSGVVHAEQADPADRFGATAEEKQEIESLFAGGVIL